MTDSPPENIPWRHLHVSAIFLRTDILVVIALFAIAVPVLVVIGPETVYTKYPTQTTAIANAIFLAFFLVLFGAIHRAFHVYAFLQDSVVIRKGLVRRETRVIPFERLHNVDSNQSMPQRMYKTATLVLHTAGSDIVEAKLDGVPLKQILQLEDLLKNYHRAHETDSPLIKEPEIEHAGSQETQDAKPLVRMSTMDCIRVFLIRNQMTTIIFLLIAFAISNHGLLGDWVKTWLLPLSITDFVALNVVTSPIPWIDLSIRANADWIALTNWLVQVVLPIVAALLIASMVICLTFYQNFALLVEEDKLDARSGSIIRSRKRTPLSRIQLVQVESNIRSRLMGRESVRFSSSAGISGSPIFSPLGTWLAPLVEPTKTLPILEQVLPLEDLSSASWEIIDAKRAWPRMLKKHCVYLVPIGLILASFNVWLLLLFIPLVAWLVYVCKRSAASITFTLLEEAISYKSGWVKRTWTTRAYSKLQSIDVTQNPFDRRHGTATLVLHSAHNSGRSRIRFIKKERADALAKCLYDRSVTRDFEW
ncbi:MAG: PH domain-containing protein [Gammaproteobacteria bacterium]|nr:PH domain-containing protein [Gammaproteobacteria bacterium]